jgi:cytochrome c-type biogenesis protein
LTAGVLSFLSPCVLPLVPSYLSFVTGMTVEDLQENDEQRNVLLHAGLFVAGFSAVFLILGASASFLGAFFQAYEEWIARIGGVIIIVLGLHLMGVFRILPLLRERRVQLSDKPAGHLGTLAVGAAFGAGWTPCIGPVLGAILTLAGTQETVWSGVGLLAAYSAGLAVPFLLAAVALDRFLAAFQRFRRYIPVLEKGSGLLLVVLGLLLVTGSFTVLTGYLARFTPEWILERV